MTLPTFILSIFGLLLITGCQTNYNPNNLKENQDTLNKLKSTQHPLSGKWIYNNVAWYISTLTLNENGTFTFHDQGHYGQRFTEGRWTENSKTIILKSFKSFRKNTILNPANKTYIQKATVTSKDGERDSLFFIAKVPPPNLPGTKDTILVYFDNVQLKLTNDTLYSVGANKLPEDPKFHKAQNNR